MYKPQLQGCFGWKRPILLTARHLKVARVTLSERSHPHSTPLWQGSLLQAEVPCVFFFPSRLLHKVLCRSGPM